MAIINPLAQWRIVIKSMNEDLKRGPGEILGIIDQPSAHLAGASINYNSPGELHFTLLVDDPNILLPIPKETHYVVEFYTGGSQITFDGPTGLWVQDTPGGPITWPAAAYTEAAEGPYDVTAVNAEYSAAVGVSPWSGPGEHPASGGAYWSFWRVDSGPYEGYLVAHASGRDYGPSTISNTGAGTWVEVFAGLMWDVDATETEAVFYGIDYLTLFKYVVDERFDPDDPDAPPPTGSKYVNKQVRWILQDILQYAIDKADSPVGFLTLGEVPVEMGSARLIDAIYSTLMSVLDFTVGMIQSHRAGTGIYTRVHVVTDTDPGTYKVIIENNPGESRPDLTLIYGELAQGYRVAKFGPQWASYANVVARDRDGVKVEFRTETGYADSGKFGAISQGAVVIETRDHFDLLRRARQIAQDAAAMTRQLSVGLKLGSYRPLEEFDICDLIQVDIVHGAVDTMTWNIYGWWRILGASFETYDDGHWITNIALEPQITTGCG